MLIELVVLASLAGTALAACRGDAEEDSNESLPDSSDCYCDWSYDSDVGSSGGDRQSTLSEY